MARRPSVKPTASGTGFVLLMGVSAVIPVMDVVGVIEGSGGVSVSPRMLFDQRKKERQKGREDQSLHVFQPYHPTLLNTYRKKSRESGCLSLLVRVTVCRPGPRVVFDQSTF